MDKTIDWEQKASTALDAVAAKLGAGVDHFWPLFVREQVIQGYTCLLMIFLFWFVYIFVILVCVKFKNKLNEFAIIIPVFIGLIGFAFSSTVLIDQKVIGKILNPEYHALKEVTGLMK